MRLSPTCRVWGGTRRGDADMDWGFVMGVSTAILLIVFLGIVVWAFEHRRKASFDEAARLPLADDGEEK
jgi:cytochrome c oxidase cbb3-type subunit 4